MEHIGDILERYFDRFDKQRNHRSKMTNMDFQEPDSPRKLFIGFMDGKEEHGFEADVTGMPPDEIQAVAEMLTDDMLVHVGLIEVARYEEEDE